jgi:threonine/homoserine/homoserine lactone efflux protein
MRLVTNILKWCGWPGFQLLLRPRQAFDTRQSTAPSTSNWFLKGVLGNVLNPKMGVFMLFAARLALSYR